MKTITLKSGKEIQLNQAFNMDCLTFMKELPDKCIDLVLTDPPYGINAGKMQMGSGKNHKFDKNKTWDSEIPSKEIFDEMFRISENQIIWGGNYFTEYLPPSKHWLLWDKKNPNLSFAEGELAWVRNGKLLRIYNIYSGNQDKIHPTQKPTKLFNWCLNNYAEEGSIVYDPFLGSFTTAIAANNCNIDWIGTELDPDYFKSGYHRYEQETKQLLMEF